MSDDRILLKIYGSTGVMRLWPDKLVVMQSEVDFKRIVGLIAQNCDGGTSAVGRRHLHMLKTALRRRKMETDAMNSRSMKKSDINRSQAQIKRRIERADEIMERCGVMVWREL